MNKISDCIDFGVNKNKNYNFCLNKNEIFCLNRRVVELGIGACLVYSRYTLGNFINSSLALSNSYAVLGVVGVFKAGGAQGVARLLLGGAIFHILMLNLTERNLLTFIYLEYFMLAIIGRALFFASGITGLLIGLSLVIRKSGVKCTNKLLNYFNNWQNKVGFLEVKDNIDYQFSVLGRDVFCLKKIVFQAVCVLNVALAFLMASNGYGAVFPSHLGALASIFVIYNMLGEQLGTISFLLMESMLMLDFSLATYYYVLAMLFFIGEGFLLTGTMFSAFALLSSLIKKSGSGKFTNLKKFLNNLEDKKKVIAYEKDLERKRLALEKRREEIKAINSRIDAGVGTYSTEDSRFDFTERDDKKQVTFLKVKVKRRGKDLGASQTVSSVGKKSAEIPTQIEISVNGNTYTFQKLDGTACEKKNVWGVIISDSSNSERYQSWLNNGRIGKHASIRQLKGGGSAFEMGTGMDSRLIGHMYKPGDISNALKSHLSIDVASFVQEIKGNCGEDTCLIIFSSESKKHQDISKVSRWFK